MDCGPACLRMIARYFGKSYSLQYLRSRSYISREGVSMLGISEAAENIGFRTKGYRLTREELSDDVAEIELTKGMTSNYSEQLKFIQEMDGIAGIITEETRLIYRVINPLKSLFDKDD